MKPVSPVIPGKDLKEIIVAEHQEEYGNLPSIKFADGLLCTRWEMTTEERDFVAKNGYIYLWIWTFGNPVQPVLLEAKDPEIPEAG